MRKFILVEKNIQEIKDSANDRYTGFVIANTSDIFNDRLFYVTPIRETSTLIYGGAVVRDVATTYELVHHIDGMVDFIFVDAEKKIRKIYYGPNDIGNIERAVRETVVKSKVVTYKGNDLCVDAIDQLLEQLVVGLDTFKVGIIGAGNVGSKIILRMIERGAHVVAFRRDKDKLKRIITGLNNIKSDNTIAKASSAYTIEDAFKNVDIIIACANEKNIIGKRPLSLMNKNGPHILIDVGKGCFSAEAVSEADRLNIKIYRLDVSVVQRHIFSALIETNKMYDNSIGRRRIGDDVSIISLGLLGKHGEIIVDNITKPKRIIGISDGNGSVVTDPSIFQEKLNVVEKFILSDK